MAGFKREWFVLLEPHSFRSECMWSPVLKTRKEARKLKKQIKKFAKQFEFTVKMCSHDGCGPTWY